MKKMSILIPVLVTGICSTASYARPARATAQRGVELITIGGNTSMANPAPADVSPQPGLQVNELSRRAVEFRMAQALAEMSSDHGAALPASPMGAFPMATGPVALTSTIVTPTWMRTIAPLPATMTFVPGCGASAYRPTGFLTGAAERRRAAYYGLMSSVACEQGIPVGLFDAMILRESGYDPAAISPKQAFGFAQLMPATASALGVNRYDPLQNMRGGARYLRQQLDRFGRVELALAAYNAGPGRVRSGMAPAITETQAYVTSILANWQRISTAGAASHPEIIATR
ncbi:lytic transglycosylase domain-containing protein [Sphingomonas bacterium]|uniref:lytic transglycosylase domain-containing protein n=1 Tax=Sphingomonas bacterium TaxID=1895847 RepID=UPI001C2DCD99|nr:lytic transglycosylase domain-containing protein [Sphingomonas bacterium]